MAVYDSAAAAGDGGSSSSSSSTKRQKLGKFLPSFIDSLSSLSLSRCRFLKLVVCVLVASSHLCALSMFVSVSVLF